MSSNLKCSLNIINLLEIVSLIIYTTYIKCLTIFYKLFVQILKNVIIINDTISLYIILNRSIKKIKFDQLSRFDFG